MKICYSTNGFKQHTLAETFHTLSSIGYQGVEIAPNPIHFPENNFSKQINPINELSQQYQLPITNIHLGEPLLVSETPHYPSLISKNNIERNQRLDLIKKGIELAEGVGSPYVTVTSGLKEEVTNPQESFERLLDSLALLQQRLPPHITLLIEQEPEMFVATTEDLQSLIKATDANYQINLDIGHLEVTKENIPTSIRALKNSIANIHFEDIKNHIHQHLTPGEGDINFAAFFDCLKECAYAGNITADLYPFSHQAEKTAKNTFQFVKNHI